MFTYNYILYRQLCLRLEKCEIARFGQGNHKKAWKQEIRRDQSVTTSITCTGCFPANYYNTNIIIQIRRWGDDQSFYYTSMCAYNHDDL